MTYPHYHLIDKVSPLQNNTAEKLSSLRHKHSISQERLAQLTGLRKQDLVHYERSNQPVPAASLALISKALGVSMKYFL